MGMIGYKRRILQEEPSPGGKHTKDTRSSLLSALSSLKLGEAVAGFFEALGGKSEFSVLNEAFPTQGFGKRCSRSPAK